MSDKKNPGRFTLQFNAEDPQHRAVIDLLNRQGRNKAQFLTSAVLHYVNCAETPEHHTAPPDSEQLEKLVLEILAKYGCVFEKDTEPVQNVPPASGAHPDPTVQREPEAEAWLGEEERVSAILRSLELFRQEQHPAVG